MRTRDFLLTGIFLLLFAGAVVPLAGQTVVKEQEMMIRSLKEGDGVTIGTLLNDVCDLELPEYRGTYSKAQAGKIVSDFFKNHPVSSFRIIRQGTLAEKEQYTLAEMKSKSKTWKIYFIIKGKDGKWVVPLFRITE